MSRRTIRSVVAALGAVALAPLPSCGLLGSGDSVALFGDSLTLLVADAVKAGADDEFSINVSGTWGLRVDELLDQAAEVSNSDPSQVVINLGTNNVLQHHDAVASAQDLASMLDQFADVPCVHVVTLNEHINRLGEDFAPDAAALNAQIRELAGRQLNTNVIDWNAIVTEHLAEGIISEDTVHPNSKGVELLADAYLDALRTC